MKPKTNVDEYLSKIWMSETSIYLSPVTYQELGRLIDRLPNKVSSRYDNVNNILLKNIKPWIISPLVGIFNSSLLTGVFPKLMKTAIVVPLHKGQSTLELSNYRPISLLLTISKLLEKVMYTRVYDFLLNVIFAWSWLAKVTRDSVKWFMLCLLRLCLGVKGNKKWWVSVFSKQLHKNLMKSTVLSQTVM